VNGQGEADAGHPRAEILSKFRSMVADRQPIVGGGAGTGLSAKSEEAGGIDLIIIYNSGRYRMAGRGSAAGLLAYGNANEIVREMALEVLPVVKKTPVLAGVNGTDPFVLMPQFLSELKAMGFSGVQNFPTIGLFDGVMRTAFEETGMGYGLEVDMIAEAHKLDLLTTPYVFNPQEARDMTAAGADIIVAHMGVTTGGAIGAKAAKSLEQCVAEIDAIADAARAVRDDVIVLCHGGPIAMPEDAKFILARAPHATASMAPARWSGCRLRSPSSSRSRISRRCRCGGEANAQGRSTWPRTTSSIRATSAPSGSTGASCHSRLPPR
jgi:predicted TIM-barrel enzyme